MTGCWNGAVRVWSSNTGQPLTESMETEGLLWRLVAFDQMGQCIATGGNDATVRLWPIPTSPAPVPGWFLTFVESIAGIRLGARGQTEYVGTEFDAAVLDLKSRAADDYYARLARWLIAHPIDRGATPF